MPTEIHGHGRRRVDIPHLSACIVVLALTAGLTPSAGAAPGETTWTIVPSPSVPGVGQRLTSVSASSATDAWAVGDFYNRTLGAQQTMILRWDGTRWGRIRSPNASGSYNTLTSVAVVDDDEAWAVGYVITQTNDWRTLIEAWNGTSWRIVPGAPISPEYGALYGVAALSSGEAWVVGSQGSVDPTPLIEYWDGNAWTQVAAPAFGDYSELYAVSAIASDDVWAAGYWRRGNSYGALTMHWDGAAWTLVSAPNPTSIGFVKGLTAVASDDVWAVGYSVAATGSRSTPLVEHWNGTEWTVADSPRIWGSYTQLDAIAALSPTNAVAIGSFDDAQGEFHPLIEEWDTGSWSQVTAPEPAGFEPITYGVAPDMAGGYWAVGYSYKEAPLTLRTFILRSSSSR